MGYSIRLDETERAIWQKFHVKHGDVPPFMGWEGTRDTLAELFGELGFTSGAEIGVQRGRYSRKLLELNPKLYLKCVDPWAPFTHHKQEWQDRQLEVCLQKLKPFAGRFEIIRKTGNDASLGIEDGSLDFVYIDAMHDFDSVMMDLLMWVPKVRKGGIISGHDYEHYYTCGVIPAVDAYTRAHNVALYYITPKDPPRSFFWVKQ